MRKERMKLWNWFYAFLDACILVMAYLLAYYVRFYSPLLPIVGENYYPLGSYAVHLVYLVPIYLLICMVFRLYSVTGDHLRTKVLKSVLSNVTGIILLFLILYVLKEYNISRKFLLIFFLINTVMSTCFKILITYFANRKLQKV
jgi:uncharacterized membrane protein